MFSIAGLDRLPTVPAVGVGVRRKDDAALGLVCGDQRMDMSNLRVRLRSRDRRRRPVSRPLLFETMEPRQLLATLVPFVVNNIGDNGGIDPLPFSGTGTLRQAIIDANATTNPAPSIPDLIVF